MLFSNCAYVAAGFLFGGVVAGTFWLAVHLARLKLLEVRRQYQLDVQREAREVAVNECRANPPQLRAQFQLHGLTNRTAAEPLPELQETDLSGWATVSATRLSPVTPGSSCVTRWKNRRTCSLPRRRPFRARR
jgi:hypothetical protein